MANISHEFPFHKVLRQPSLTLSAVVSTGWPQLDSVLPGGGWPLGGLVEVVTDLTPMVAAELLVPSLATVSWEDRWIAWIKPPAVPDAEQLEDRGVDLSRVLIVHERAGESSLRIARRGVAGGTMAVVLVWASESDPEVELLLQHAAEEQGATVFIFRPPEFAYRPANAKLRVRLGVNEVAGAQVEVLHCNGGANSVLALGLGGPENAAADWSVKDATYVDQRYSRPAEGPDMHYAMASANVQPNKRMVATV